MTADHQRAKASQPEDLGRLFVARANAGDIQGLVALYESLAVLALPDGFLATGHDAIAIAYKQLLSTGRLFVSESQRPALRIGDLAQHPAAFPTALLPK